MPIQSSNNNVNFGSLQRVFYADAMYRYSKRFWRQTKRIDFSILF